MPRYSEKLILAFGSAYGLMPSPGTRRDHEYAIFVCDVDTVDTVLDLHVIFVAIVELVVIFHSICDHVEIDLVPQKTSDTTETFYKLVALL